MSFTLSYYKPQTTVTLVRRPWWAFWRHDKLVTQQTLVRTVFADLPEDEAKVFVAVGDHAGKRLARRLIGDDATMLQLEVEQPAPQYAQNGLMKSYGSSNLILHSEGQS